MGKTSTRSLKRNRRKVSIRKHLVGTTERPRLTVFRTTKHIYAQIVDDVKGATLAAASTQSKAFKAKGHSGNSDAATKVGVLIAKAGKKAGVEKVVFDRNGNLFHGRLKALAEAAREGGLDF
jgi:large subunit ribosomal protein L18